MATIKCDKVKIITKKEKAWELLEILQKFGNVELVPRDSAADLYHENLEKERDKVRQESELIASVLKVFGAENQKKKSFIENLEDDRIKITEHDIKKIREKRDQLLEDAKNALSFYEELTDLRARLSRTEKTLKDIHLLKDIEINVFGYFAYIFAIPFLVKNDKKEDFIQELKANFGGIEVSQEAADEEFTAFVVVGAKEDEDILRTFLNDKTQIISIADETKVGSPKEVYHQLTEEKKHFSEELKKKEVHFKKLAQEKKEILALKDILDWDIQKLEALDSYQIMNDGRIAINFWASPADLDEVKREVHLIDEDAVITLHNLPIEQRKVALKNLNFFKSFELITTTMGFPAAKEADPTPILTPFFIFFFGLALSDAGYGLLLTLLGGYLLFFRNLKPSVKGMINVIFWCGISTVIFGAMLGSWFGFVPDSYVIAADANPFIRAISPLIEALKWAMVVDPVANIPLMLGVMLTIGVIHLTTGYVVGFIAKAKHNELLSGLLDDLVPGLLLVALFLFALTNFLDPFKSLTGVMQIVVLALLGVTVIAKGRKAGVLLCLPVGILQTFMSTVGYLSETLSYARLLALGVATGVIAGVINILAFMTAGVPYIGFIFVMAVLLVGHMINIMLNVLGSYVTSSRLQFVEFFPKFMSASGKPLIPFKRNLQHVIIK